MKAPLAGHVAALACATLAPVLGLGVLAELAFADRYPLLLSQLLCAAFALGLALVWPVPGWRWGLWVSAGFWLFLGLVFIGFARLGRLVWLPLGEAVAVTAAACAAAWLGARLRRRPSLDRP